MYNTKKKKKLILKRINLIYRCVSFIPVAKNNFILTNENININRLKLKYNYKGFINF